MRVLGINAVFHDPAAALVIDGKVVAAAEEERFTRRKHGKRSLPFSTWELPESAARWCLAEAGLGPRDIDVVAYSYAPMLAPPVDGDLTRDEWEGLRTLFATRAPLFVESILPGLNPRRVVHVPHHVAHAASAYLSAPYDCSAVLVVDGRGERASHLAGHATGCQLRILAKTDLPSSLGFFYEALAEHIGFRRSSDELKVMALAAFGKPRFLEALRPRLRATAEGALHVDEVDFSAFAPAVEPGGAPDDRHADLAASAQRALEDVLLEHVRWLHAATGARYLTMAGGVALNCVANARLLAEGPFEDIWVQPAAGDAGTALGAALYITSRDETRPEPMRTAALGRSFSDEEVEHALTSARMPYTRPADLAAEVAGILAKDGLVAWFQGRSEFGPRALGHRSLLADPRREGNLERLSAIKGRESFRPVSPMVLAERAGDIFEGQLPSPYMLFTHRVRDAWRGRIPAVVHVDGTSRIQTVDAAQEPLLHRAILEFARQTDVPLIVNTSLNTAGRPLVDDPRDALECFASAAIDALAIGPYLVRRGAVFAGGAV